MEINLPAHFAYLKDLPIEEAPKVIYDIGACFVEWSDSAKKIWPDAEFILFEAADMCESFYKDYNYHIGVLSDESGKTVKFYQNDEQPGGNSYYREINHGIFPESTARYLPTYTLDEVVAQRGFPYPDFIKIDVQGAELDVLKGAKNVLSWCTHIIAELRLKDYNEGSPFAEEVIEYLESQGFENKGQVHAADVDADYYFVNTSPKKHPVHYTS